MAGNLERLTEEPSEAMEKGEGQIFEETGRLASSTANLQAATYTREAAFPPFLTGDQGRSVLTEIGDLIHRVNELQQAKKKSGQELGDAQALWEALNRELDSLHGEEVHLEVLSKKQGIHPRLAVSPLFHPCPSSARSALQRSQGRPSGTGWAAPCCSLSRLAAASGNSESLRSPGQGEAAQNPRPVFYPELAGEAARLARKQGRACPLGEGGGAGDRRGQVLELRLTREIRALQRSQEQLRAEGTLVRARLQEVERRLRLAAEVGGDPVVTGGLKAELQSSEGPGPSASELGVRREVGVGGRRRGARTDPGQKRRGPGERRGPQPHSRFPQAQDAGGDLEPQAEAAPTLAEIKAEVSDCPRARLRVCRDSRGGRGSAEPA
ncbi:Meiosis-related protein [Heterocephalus glaber]|uniref:Meiosis-related protein n=1 Tax=Heterocephalus glaber TaxID=10181 RepID=G5BE13_HETGA|nr:Meiosis-related protein [Heterocephalus glaber]